MNQLSNLPPGCTDADIDEAAGEFDVQVLHWAGAGYYYPKDADHSHNAGRGHTYHWHRTVMDNPDQKYVGEPQEWHGVVIYPEVIVLALCEHAHTIPCMNVLYKYEVVADCAECKRLAATYEPPPSPKYRLIEIHPDDAYARRPERRAELIGKLFTFCDVSSSSEEGFESGEVVDENGQAYFFYAGKFEPVTPVKS